MSKNWQELKIETPFEKWNSLEEYLYVNDIYSFEVIDPRILEEQKANKTDWDFLDENIYKDIYNGVTVKIYNSEFSNLENIDKLIEDIKARDLGETTIRFVDEEDWANNWKSFYYTQKIGNRLVIKPSWEDYTPDTGEIVMNLDPGMAFGTGTHETTNMCLVQLEKYMKSNDIVYDIGSGSGILSIAAKLLGAKKVVGVDLDPMCIRVSKENAEINHVEVEFIEGDLFAGVSGKANLIVSNIIAEIIVDLIEQIKTYLVDDGIFITSGIIVEKSHLVMDKLNSSGFEIIEEKVENGWTSIVARLIHA